MEAKHHLALLAIYRQHFWIVHELYQMVLKTFLSLLSTGLEALVVVLDIKHLASQKWYLNWE